MNNKQFIKKLKEVQKIGLELIKKKNKDYAREEDPYRNFRLSEMVNVPLEKAILIRMTDKISRVSTLLDTGKASVIEETIQDTLLDLMNYAAILAVYIKNNN